MEEYNRSHLEFAPFAVNAHANALTTKTAVFRAENFGNKIVDEALFESSREVSPPHPIRLFDASPICDGAAAVVISSDPAIGRQTASEHEEKAGESSASSKSLIEIVGSAAVVDSLALEERRHGTHLKALQLSTERAMKQVKPSLFVAVVSHLGF